MHHLRRRELSAINAVTGSFAEHVPVVHLVGAPSTSAQAAQRIVHHSLGDGIFTHFLDMHRNVTCARAALTTANATAEIDRVLIAVRDRKLPGYLLLPTDVAATPASKPTDPLPPAQDYTDAAALAGFIDAARRVIGAADDAGGVRLLAGLLVHRFGAAEQLREITALGVPHASSAWAKSVVDESDPAFLGIYAGAASAPEVRTAIEDAPALIVAGVEFTDLNSGFFTHQIPRARTIELGADAASVGPALFGPISIGTALHALAGIITELPPATARTTPAASEPAGDTIDRPLSQEMLWSQVTGFLQPGDIVVAEQGTSFYGMATHRIPSGVTFVGQPLWASIGYTIPASLGAALAQPHRRTVLIVGDGAAQMTVQELSTALHLLVDLVVVIVDNDGYTVERAIHGPDQSYNDIASWDWTALPAFIAPGVPAATHRATTTAQLATALHHTATGTNRFTLIQAVVPQMDVPDLLRDIAHAAAAANTQSQINQPEV